MTDDVYAAHVGDQKDMYNDTTPHRPTSTIAPSSGHMRGESPEWSQPSPPPYSRPPGDALLSSLTPAPPTTLFAPSPTVLVPPPADRKSDLLIDLFAGDLLPSLSEHATSAYTSRMMGIPEPQYAYNLPEGPETLETWIERTPTRARMTPRLRILRAMAYYMKNKAGQISESQESVVSSDSHSESDSGHTLPSQPSTSPSSRAPDGDKAQSQFSQGSAASSYSHSESIYVGTSSHSAPRSWTLFDSAHDITISSSQINQAGGNQQITNNYYVDPKSLVRTRYLPFPVPTPLHTPTSWWPNLPFDASLPSAGLASWWARVSPDTASSVVTALPDIIPDKPQTLVMVFFGDVAKGCLPFLSKVAFIAATIYIVPLETRPPIRGFLL